MRFTLEIRVIWRPGAITLVARCKYAINRRDTLLHLAPRFAFALIWGCDKSARRSNATRANNTNTVLGGWGRIKSWAARLVQIYGLFCAPPETICPLLFVRIWSAQRTRSRAWAQNLFTFIQTNSDCTWQNSSADSASYWK